MLSACMCMAAWAPERAMLIAGVAGRENSCGFGVLSNASSVSDKNVRSDASDRLRSDSTPAE